MSRGSAFFFLPTLSTERRSSVKRLPLDKVGKDWWAALCVLERKMQTKWCSKCGECKSLDEFYIQRRNKNGHSCWCKTCHLNYDRKYRVANPDKIKKQNRKKYVTHRDERIAYAAKYYAAHKEQFAAYDAKRRAARSEEERKREKERARTAHLKREFGITPDEYDAMLSSQNGKCAICGSSDPDKRYKRFYVDHDHKTGRVRGLLCIKCNSALAQFGDDIEGIKKVVLYLMASQTVTVDGGVSLLNQEALARSFLPKG